MQLERGIREVRITSLDTAAYGKDIDKNLAGLVREISQINDDFKLRIGMMEPRNTHDILPELPSFPFSVIMISFSFPI